MTDYYLVYCVKRIRFETFSSVRVTGNYIFNNNLAASHLWFEYNCGRFKIMREILSVYLWKVSGLYFGIHGIFVSPPTMKYWTPLRDFPRGDLLSFMNSFSMVWICEYDNVEISQGVISLMYWIEHVNMYLWYFWTDLDIPADQKELGFLVMECLSILLTGNVNNASK